MALTWDMLRKAMDDVERLTAVPNVRPGVIWDPHAVETVGAWIDVPYSRHRSQRLWKKLLRGTRRAPATHRPMCEPTMYRLRNGTIVAHPFFEREFRRLDLGRVPTAYQVLRDLQVQTVDAMLHVERMRSGLIFPLILKLDATTT